MSIQYKMVGKNDNLNPADSKKKGFYPVVVRKKTVGIKELAKTASNHCHLNQYEMEMAINVLIETIQNELLESNNVCLEGFGTFSLKAESRNVEKPEDIRAESIFVKKVTFKNSPILINEIKNTGFVKYNENN